MVYGIACFMALWRHGINGIYRQGHGDNVPGCIRSNWALDEYMNTLQINLMRIPLSSH
jgi:hypothetical protein